MQKYEITLIFSNLSLLFILLVSKVNSNRVKLKVNKIGSVQLLNTTYVPKPDEFRIKDEIKEENGNTIIIDNIDDEIELIWNNKLTMCDSMFRGMREITEIDLSQFDSSDVTNMKQMFRNCISLQSINLDNLNTANVESMEYMFTNCVSLQSINLDNFNTGNVENMEYMFYNCRSLTSLNVSNFETSQVTSMEGMFAYCDSLESLDLSTFNTQSVMTFYFMFGNCVNLKYLNLSGMQTNSAVNFGSMFFNCSSLKSSEISHFESKIYTMLIFSYMFYNCSSLTSLNIPNLVKTDSKAYLILMEGMFEECKNLKYLNLKGCSKSSYDDMFVNTPENMVACFPDDSENSSLRKLFSEKTCEVIDCSEDWETKQKKINGETGDCMDSCSGDFLYEYNTICYRKCPPGTKNIENQYLCEERIIEDEIIHTTNEVLETIELSYKNEREENNEIETNEEEEEKDIMQEINEKEKIKISDINTNENEKITNTVENNEEKINKDTNNNNENEDYKGTKVAIISIGVSICVVVIVATLAIICFIRKIAISNNIAPVISSVNPAISSNIDNKNNMIEEPKENKIQENPINIYNVHFQPASPEVENSQDSIKFNIIKDLKEIKN